MNRLLAQVKGFVDFIDKQKFRYFLVTEKKEFIQSFISEIYGLIYSISEEINKRDCSFFFEILNTPQSQDLLVFSSGYLAKCPVKNYFFVQLMNLMKE